MNGAYCAVGEIFLHEVLTWEPIKLKITIITLFAFMYFGPANFVRGIFLCFDYIFHFIFSFLMHRALSLLDLFKGVLFSVRSRCMARPLAWHIMCFKCPPRGFFWEVDNG